MKGEGEDLMSSPTKDMQAKVRVKTAHPLLIVKAFPVIPMPCLYRTKPLQSFIALARWWPIGFSTVHNISQATTKDEETVTQE